MAETARTPDEPDFHLSSRTDLSEVVDAWKARTGIRQVVAFSGGADRGLGPDVEPEAVRFMEARMEREVAAAVNYLKSYHIAVLTGGTKFGVPAVAATAAKRAGLGTIGVFPWIGVKHALTSDIIDLQICVEPRFGESCWGDESAVFAKMLDGVIVYGGGAGTLVEAAHLLKINEHRLKHEQRPKFIVPIGRSGGTADTLPYFPAKVEVRAACMPQTPISSGLQAAAELERRLNLFDYSKHEGEGEP